MEVTKGVARARDSLREWRLVTKPYCQKRFPDLLTLGEVELPTGADGEIRRRVDGVVLRTPSSGPAGQLHPAEVGKAAWSVRLPELHGNKLVAVQTKVERVGFSVLGQALVSARLVQEQFEAPETVGLALGTDIEETLEYIVTRDFGSVLDIDACRHGTQPSPATRKGPYDRVEGGGRRHAAIPSPLARRAEEHLLSGGFRRVPHVVRLTSDEAVEALYVRGVADVSSLSELAGREVVVLHALGKTRAKQPKPTNMPLVGHAIFAAKVIELAGAHVVTVLLVHRHDDVVTRIARGYGVRVYDPRELDEADPL